MKISKQARRDAKALFQASKANGVLDEKRVRAAVTELIGKKPRGYVGILSHYHRLVRLDLDRRTALVESAAPLSSALTQNVKAGLEARYGQGLQIQFATNPSLIGGLRVKVGSDVFDGSVKSRLVALEESL